MNKILITLIYAFPEKQYILYQKCFQGTTVKQAIYQSKILKTFPEINFSQNLVGIFNQLVSLDTKLLNGDRIEIYRPLIYSCIALRKQRLKTFRK